LPIIVVSGYFYKDDATIQQAQTEGWIRDFIGKPFLYDELVGALERALSGR
jgi:FixJ family two-component response regulator